jgi:F-type H+-transporting ATPase subunit b
MTFVLSVMLLLTTAQPLLAAAEGDGPNPFAGTIYQSIATVIVFLLLLGLLYRFAWGPILTGLQDRENRIKADLEETEAAAREANATLTEYKQKLSEAAIEAQRVVEQARIEAQKLGAQLRHDADQDIQQQRQRALREIESARQQAVSDIYEQSATLGTQIAGRILQRELNEADHRALISAALAELTAKGGQRAN